MRSGLNPMLNQPAPRHFPPLLGAVITHLPNQKDYHGVRLTVIQKCLLSMRKHAGRDLPFLIWDNGSCEALTDWLRITFKPEWLVLSSNVGKSSARATIMHMLPPETIICKSDDDMLYYPGWLTPQLEILNTYPNVGMVSGWPVRRSLGISNDKTVAWAKANADISTGRFITDAEETEFALSIGNKPESIISMFKDQIDLIAEYQGVKAYLSAQHCQFIAHAGVIAPFCQWMDDALPTERPFDKAIDDAGLLRLTTTTRLVKHIGNIFDQKLEIETESWKL
jgi:hypothetical protein